MTRGSTADAAQAGPATFIRGARIVTPEGILDPGDLLMEGDRIAGFGRPGSVAPPAGAEIVDAGGLYLGPGFIDLHCHGGGPHAAHLDPAGFAHYHLRHGTTGILPTIAYNVPHEPTAEGIRRIVAAMPGEPSILGIHLEGPYTNPTYGSQSATARRPAPAEYREYLDLGRGAIRVWTFAPELDGIEEFVRAVSGRGIVLSVGHSEAAPELILGYISRGLRLACHTYCATGVTPARTRYGGTRETGVDETVMVCDDITAEIIPDRDGIHVRPLMARLLLKAKGPDRVAVITDCTLSGPGATGDVNWNAAGELSGSVLTMDRAAANMMAHTGAGMVDGFRMASGAPARVLGVEGECGSIRLGMLANLVLVNDRMEISRVFLRGREVAR